MSSLAFKALAYEQMSPGDAAALDYWTLDPDLAGSSVADQLENSAGGLQAKNAASKLPALVKRWREWERTLRLNIAQSRALKQKRELNVEVPKLPSDAVLAAKGAVAMDNPLEAEVFLDKTRWSFISDLQGMDTFSRNAMYAYLLKLLLMERRMAFNFNEGFTEYKALYTAILGEAK
jgi:hypothetical protein